MYWEMEVIKMYIDFAKKAYYIMSNFIIYISRILLIRVHFNTYKHVLTIMKKPSERLNKIKCVLNSPVGKCVWRWKSHNACICHIERFFNLRSSRGVIFPRRMIRSATVDIS